MSAITQNKKKRDPQKAFIIKKLAEKWGVTTRLIYMIVDGERENEEIFTDYMTMLEATNMPTNLLLKAVEQLVPFK